MNLARLCARLKHVFLFKKSLSRARLLTKMSPSEELGTLRNTYASIGDALKSFVPYKNVHISCWS